MRITAISLIIATFIPICGYAQRSHRLREIVVTAQRSMKDIGAQVTKIDSAALKENIALSMADVLTFNSGIFVKSYGRATLSTVAFRGTSPSHTQVTWNGMKINNPMLGMTDFSTIPSYFIDRASLLHGTSSVNETGGGLGGLVRLGTIPDAPDGFNVQYVQGIGSFNTYDEFLRMTYHDTHWTTSTRVVYSSSPNDYKYTNRDKKLNIYDDNHNIIGQYYPEERNKSGAYRDFHALQEVYYDDLKGNRFGLNAWYINSRRELPLLTTDYASETAFENKQRENTFRGILSWKHDANLWSTDIRAGYIHTYMAYDYRREVGGGGGMASMTRSRSLVNTFYAQGDGTYYSDNKKWLITANISAYQHFVRSEDKNVIMQHGDLGIVGYDKGRVELSGSASAKWQPIQRIGMSVVLRQEMSGDRWAPVIPAFFIDGILSYTGNITAKASISRNHKFPTLNDLYFLPGGNPDLKNEDGFTYDCSFGFDTGRHGVYALRGSLSWFDSYIDNWILWLPTTKGFFSPRNMKKVHAYGIEIKSDLAVQLHRDWLLDLNGSYSWTPSINRGDPMSPADKSVGKQLPYVPRHSASVTGRLSWKSWSFLYKWAYYSERYTMSSNEYTISGHLPEYFMSNISLGKNVPVRWADIDLKLAVNNLFNEDYISVLSRPMPGINFEVFIGITPKW